MTRTIRTIAAAALAAAILVPLQAGASREPGTGWYRVAFDGRITEAGRAALIAAGGTGLQYVPANTYLVWLEGSEVEPARAVSSVASVTRVGAVEKVAPKLRKETGPALVTAVVHAPALASVERALEGLGDITIPGAVQPGLGLADVVVLAPPGAIARIAALPEVLHVGTASPGLFTEDEASAQIQAGNLNAAGTAPAGPGYEAWLASRGLSGSGVRIAIVDTGIDGNHPDLMGRIAATVNYTTAEVIDSGGHGTHVSGIVGGNASALRPAGGVKDGSGYLYGLGVAPQVQFVAQNAIATTQGDFPPSYGLQRYSRDAVRNGAVAWNASWHTGEGAGVGYIENARVLDIMSRDADWETPGAEP
ncbi:MAG TPA: S8 family serine peptidase, partial [Actinomycetota bacterium]